MQVLFRSYELDTAILRVGYYWKHEDYERINDIPIYEKPATRHYIIDKYGNKYEIAPEYLSINIEDMIDSQGNKIFASLSEDGKGGDIITYDEDVRIIAIYKNGTFIFKDSMNLAIVPSSRYLRTKVIGIQK